ncbi:hypothetical protein DVH05_002785 [Phytophthora capsici]|nr:hypothetical protein DVH05_002785 [Phytophthora capsici]
MTGTRMVTASMTTTRTTRSKKAKATETEEKNEDNDEVERMGSAVSAEPPQTIDETDPTLQRRLLEPVSDAATEPYEYISEEVLAPTENEMEALERTVQRLSAAVARTGMGRETTPSHRMRQLAERLQRLTTSLVEPATDAQKALLEEKAPPPTGRAHGEEAAAPATLVSSFCPLVSFTVLSLRFFRLRPTTRIQEIACVPPRGFKRSLAFLHADSRDRLRSSTRIQEIACVPPRGFKSASPPQLTAHFSDLLSVWQPLTPQQLQHEASHSSVNARTPSTAVVG